jgi:hypothetical protein
MRWVDLGGTWIKEGLISDQCAEYGLRKNSKFDFGWATMPKIPEITVDSAKNRALTICCKRPALKSNFHYIQIGGTAHSVISNHAIAFMS